MIHRHVLALLVPLLLVAAMAACTVNRRVEVAPEPEAVSRYLEASRPADLQVTDTTGRTTWLHNPRIAGDSLVGVAGRDDPRARRAVPLTAIRTLAVPQFSTGRTLGLVGGIVGAAGLTLLVVATDGPQPVY